MARLAESDYRKALEVLYAAGETAGPLPFAEPVLEALRNLVPCDVVAFHERSATQDRQFLHAGRRRLRADRARDVLSVREREVLAHVADGLTNAEVARVLTISPETVRKHLENAYEKLGVHTRTAAVAAVAGRAVRDC